MRITADYFDSLIRGARELDKHFGRPLIETHIRAHWLSGNDGWYYFVGTEGVTVQ